MFLLRFLLGSDTMSVDTYTIGLSRFQDFPLRYESPGPAVEVLRAWRNNHETATACGACDKPLDFALERRVDPDEETPVERNFAVCCDRFYYRPASCYVPESLAVRTPGYEFLLPCMKRTLAKTGIRSDQEFLVIPDPIYWQVLSTLTYERTLRFASGVPMTKKTQRVLPASKAPAFYKQVQEAPLNHGSLSKRSGGKNTFFRQIALGKRCELSARAMIVPDTDLRPNEITIPRRVAELFGLAGQWIVLNRMPSLQPENFVGLRVARVWEHECFGVPLEILRQINGDFDGDECNLYIARSPAAQAECELLLNSERSAGSPTLGLKLHPCQDMLVAYRRALRDVGGEGPLRELFPPGATLDPSLEHTLQAVYDLEGSGETFDCFARLTRFYLREMQDEYMFGLGVEEIERLAEIAEECRFDFEAFAERVRQIPREELGCLAFQVFANAKGSLYHAFQMVGSVGHRGENSFWKGLSVKESLSHALAAFLGFKMSNDIWKPGYVFYKNCFCLQGLHANYEGNLVDGKRVIEEDALRACHHSMLMSEKGFERLVRECFGARGGNEKTGTRGERKRISEDCRSSRPEKKKRPKRMKEGNRKGSDKTA